MLCSITQLEESATVCQRQLANVQSALLTVDTEHDEYCRHLDVEKQRHGGSEALLWGRCTRLVDQTFLVPSIRGFFQHNVDCNVEVY